MAVIFTARLRVHDWRALRRLSDETLLLYARAAGARRYQIYRDTHDAAEALLLVEAASAAALRPVSDALFRLDDATLGGRVAGERTGPAEGRLWEPAGCRAIEAAPEGLIAGCRGAGAHSVPVGQRTQVVEAIEPVYAKTRGTTMHENLSLLLRSLEAWNRHDLAAYREIYAPDAVIRGVAPAPLGVAETLGVYMAFFAAFPDLQLSVEETICEGERIAVRFAIGGTHQGEFQGIPPTGRRIAVQGITTMRYHNGRIVERWNQFDQLGMLQQLGALPAPAQA